ncbi:MAG: pseudouridine synthase [Candidatus Aminicenantes bacterium]
MRLNKFLAQAGVASRREADRMITEGRISVNDTVIEELGIQIDPLKDFIRVDGKRVRLDRADIYILLNKPAGYLVTLEDPFKRPTILELLPKLKKRVFPVGRLDLNSEGLLLITNNGELANRLMHPRYGIKKVYEVKTKGIPTRKSLQKLERGIYLDGKKRAPAHLTHLGSESRSARIRIELTEGRKREVRRMFDAIGHTLFSLKRINYAGIGIGTLKKGEWRYLTPSEVDGLKGQVGLGKKS